MNEKIVVIRIRGRVNVPNIIKKNLDMLKLRKKFSCVIINKKPEMLGMINKAKDYIAYGNINKDTLKELILKRGKFIKNQGIKITKEGKNEKENKTKSKNEQEINSFVKQFFDGKKELKDLNIKPFFSLHPPRGGFKKSTKKAWPEGVLGKNEKINELLLKML